MTIIDEKFCFPHPSTADSNGVLAIGGDLHPERLLLAYQYGIFPWFNEGDPVIWWHPDPRFVIYPDEVKIAKSMRPYFNQEKYSITFDRSFIDVIDACQNISRKGQPGTWITEDIIDAYDYLHQMGYAHSVEVWADEELVGGLYGVSLGKVFFGESMFSKEKNTSKIALIALCRVLEEKGFQFIDCQIANAHLKSMGGRYISREEFMSCMRKNIFEETIRGSWVDIAQESSLKNMIKKW